MSFSVRSLQQVSLVPPSRPHTGQLYQPSLNQMKQHHCYISSFLVVLGPYPFLSSPTAAPVLQRFQLVRRQPEVRAAQCWSLTTTVRLRSTQ